MVVGGCGYVGGCMCVHAHVCVYGVRICVHVCVHLRVCMCVGGREGRREKSKGEGGRERGVRSVCVCVYACGRRGREGVKKGGIEMCERCVYVGVAA